MIFYHLSFILGYVIFINVYSVGFKEGSIKLSKKFFYVSFFFGLVGVLNTYQNLMLGESFIPYDFFSDFVKGIQEPGLVYAERMSILLNRDVSSSRLFNVLSIFFSFYKLLFIFIFIYFWKDLTLIERVFSILYSFLFLSCGISSGTNSVIFIFMIFSFSSYLVVLYMRGKGFLRAVFILGVLFLIPVGMFGYLMSKRGGGFDYFFGTSPLGDITVSVATPDFNGILDFYYYSFVWLNYYLVQGYYGFSLILNMNWNWTYGFGNSAFLQRQLEVITGVDISKDTFQARISPYWDENAQWHSFYGQIANDVGFIGVGVVMFLLGGMLACIWKSVLYKSSFYGVALLPIYILLLIFIPANNQVFGYIDTLSYFVFVSILWFFEGKKVRFR